MFKWNRKLSPEKDPKVYELLLVKNKKTVQHMKQLFSDPG